MNIFFLFIFILTFFAGESVWSNEDLPLWEVGILGGGVETSDYPGSNESEFRWIAFPNFRYRGEVLRSDETEGTRARIYDDPIYKIDLSFDFNFPIDSDENIARQGMDDVDLVFEVGPRARIRLHEFDEINGRLLFLLPLRKGLTADFFRLGDAGWSLSPGLQYSQFKLFCETCFGFFRLTASLVDRRNADLFYGVDFPDATPDRPKFSGRAGYNHMEIFTGYVYLIDQLQGFLGVLHSNFSGSVNSGSPLLVAKTNTTVIVGLGWLFWQSEEVGYE